LRELDVTGFGEIYTPDEIHGVLETRVLQGSWITPRHKIEHLVEYTRPEFLIVVNVMSTLPPWRDAKRYKLKEWEKLWIEFIKNIHEKWTVEYLHIIVKSTSNIKYCSHITPC